MNTAFDRIGHLYDLYVEPIPEKYIKLLQKQFTLVETDEIIDLGCGSGFITTGLARFSQHVQGIDSSALMIQSAKTRSSKHSVEWIHGNVEDFNFGENQYKLIFSFEAFHLFRCPEILARRCVLGLRNGGFFAVGWAQYHWEEILEEIIIRVFERAGIGWEDNINLAAIDLESLLKASDVAIGPSFKRSMSIENTSHVSRIAAFLASIEKTAWLDHTTREELVQELTIEFQNALCSEWITGLSRYFLTYCQKSF